MNWPNRYWERGDITEDGKQLWYSREVDSADRRLRADYERKYLEMKNELETG